MEILTDALFAVIGSAQQEVLAVTPYFVPPPEIVRAFRVAALRGVDVRLGMHAGHLLDKGKLKKVALTACMRKLLVIVNAMVRKQESWSYAPA